VPDSARERPHRTLPPVALTIGVSLLVRVLFASTLGYAVDEAYAVAVARPLSLSYFDHPPLHFWMAAFMTWLTGVSTPWVVRLPFIAAFTVTLIAIAQLTRALFGERAARLTTLTLASSGVLGLTSGTWVLPDGPLLAGAALAALIMHPLFVPPAPDAPIEGPRAWRWIAGGALLGLALLSKYHAALFAAALGALTLQRRDTRADLRTPWPWVALALTLLGLAPTLLWNAQHDWVSFRFQGARANASGGHWSPTPLLAMLGGQLAWLLPWIAVPLLIATARAIGALRAGAAEPIDARRRAAIVYCLVWMAGPVLLFNAVSAGGANTLPHWTAPGWLFGMPLVGWWFTRAEARPRWSLVAPLATGVLAVVLIAQAQTHLLDALLSPRARATEPTRDALSWMPALPADTNEVLLVRSWIQGGQLGAASGAPRRIVCLCADPHQFGLRANLPRTWSHAVLVERVQPWKRDWRPAPEALAGDSLTFAWRDSLRLADDVVLMRYDVARRASSALVKQNFRPIESSDREIER
jgi:hypothetical protein